MRVTYLVMKDWDRLTIKQAQAVLKALAGEELWDQEKPALRGAIEKLEKAVGIAAAKERVRVQRDEAIARADEAIKKMESLLNPRSPESAAVRAQKNASITANCAQKNAEFVSIA